MKTVTYSELPEGHKEALREFYQTYNGLNDYEFGMLFNEHFRCTHSMVGNRWEFTFTDEEYTLFVLRW